MRMPMAARRPDAPGAARLLAGSFPVRIEITTRLSIPSTTSRAVSVRSASAFSAVRSCSIV